MENFLELDRRMKIWFCMVVAVAVLVGCGGSVFLSPAENVKRGQYLIKQKKATIYGQIENQKRDIHLVIQKKGAQSMGDHILGDSAGIFTIQIDSGTYRLYNDAVEMKKPKLALFPSTCYYLHHEFTVSNKTLVYVGSYFLTNENIDISFEKQHVDSLMKSKYANFKADRTIENYPERLPIDSVFCVQESNLPNTVSPKIK
jgi:hypothetical protein